MINDSFEAERSVDRRDTLATGFKKSAIYCGAEPCNDLYVSRQILNWMRAAIGSQCSLSRSNGVMWSLFWPRYRRVQPHSTPAGFCQDGNLAIPPGDCCNSQPWISQNCWLIGLLFLLLWIFGYALFCVDYKNMFGPGGWCAWSWSCHCRYTLPDSGPKLMLLLGRLPLINY